MKAKPSGQTILLVADDPDILILVKALLTSKGYRVLAAADKRSAIRILGIKDIGVQSVAIRAGMHDCEEVHTRSLERKAKLWYFCASVEDGIIRMKGLEPAGALVLEGCALVGNAFAA